MQYFPVCSFPNLLNNKDCREAAGWQRHRSVSRGKRTARIDADAATLDNRQKYSYFLRMCFIFPTFATR
ncbi:MAG: hypothetical protein ABIP80_04190 [Ferruginibacter sp.]